jgi:hypothetical protein
LLFTTSASKFVSVVFVMRSLAMGTPEKSLVCLGGF